MTWELCERFLRNAVTATRHPTVGLDYARWRIGKVAGRPLLVHGAFDTRLQASTYSEFLSTRNLVPSPSEAKMIRNLSLNYPIFVDIGANVGVWTVALAAAHLAAHVYSFEPTPHTFSVLGNNIALNGLRNVTAAQLAVSDTSGVLPFQVTENSSLFNRLAPNRDLAEDLCRERFTSARTVAVKSLRLDDFCKERQIEKIGFLKIDVEGAEVSVMKGAEYLLRNRAIELIWIEVEPDNLREMGESIDSLAVMMKRMNYTFHMLQADGSHGPSVDIHAQRRCNMMAKPA